MRGGFWREEFKENEVEYILSRIQEIRIIQSDGKISFRGEDYDDFRSILATAIGIKTRTSAIKRRAISKTLSDTELKSDFTELDFRRLFAKHHGIIEKRDLSLFRVAIPVWNLPEFLFRKVSFSDVSINFSPSPSSPLFIKIMNRRGGQSELAIYREHFTDDLKKDLLRCRVCLASVRAHNASDAFERASEAVYSVLGLVNLARDTQKHLRLSYRIRGTLPVSEVLIGPYTSVHQSGGDLTHDGFWHEDWNGGPERKNLSPQQMNSWSARFNQLFNRARRSHWHEECQDAAARYFKAFSNPNLQESFLEGYRLFEKISGDRHDKIDDQVRRAANVFAEHDMARMLGQHLKIRRNLLSHGHSTEDQDDEILAFQMRRFLAPLLERYITNSFNFRSVKELWEFLDLPAENSARQKATEAWKRKIKLLDLAAKFREEK